MVILLLRPDPKSTRPVSPRGLLPETRLWVHITPTGVFSCRTPLSPVTFPGLRLTLPTSGTGDVTDRASFVRHTSSVTLVLVTRVTTALWLNGQYPLGFGPFGLYNYVVVVTINPGEVCRRGVGCDVETPEKNTAMSFVGPRQSPAILVRVHPSYK